MLLGASLLVARSSSAAPAVISRFSFTMTTESGVKYTYDDEPMKAAKVILPAAFAIESWHCTREAIVMNDAGSGYVGEVLCSSLHGASWATVLCSSTTVDQDFSSFHLGVIRDGKVVAVEFRLSCSTTLVPKAAPKPKPSTDKGA